MTEEIICVCRNCDFCDKDFDVCKKLDVRIVDLGGNECITLRHAMRSDVKKGSIEE